MMQVEESAMTEVVRAYTLLHENNFYEGEKVSNMAIARTLEKCAHTLLCPSPLSPRHITLLPHLCRSCSHE